MDPLSDILDSMALEGQFYFRTSFNSPWSIAVPTYAEAIRFHYVVQGECFVQSGNTPPIHLRQGDLVLVPGGAAHIISDAPDRPPVPLDLVKEQNGFSDSGTFVVGEGSENTATQMLCGHFSFADGSRHPLLRSMPSLLHLTAAKRSSAFWLDEALRLMTRHAADNTPGSMAVVRRMSEIIYIETIRCCADQSEHLSGLMEALNDPKISRAILAMHRDVSAPWTVESLANEAAMSRSRFAERFQALVGCGPLTYLGEWRLQKARGLLKDSNFSVQEIAGQIGYQSPAAFTRAFANMFGESPSKLRTRLAA